MRRRAGNARFGSLDGHAPCPKALGPQRRVTTDVGCACDVDPLAQRVFV